MSNAVGSTSSLLYLFCPSGSVSVVFVRYDSISDILKPSSDPGVTDYSRYAGTGEINVNSQVIAAAVKPADVYQLDHVTFTLRHKEVKASQGADAGYIIFTFVLILQPSFCIFATSNKFSSFLLLFLLV